MVKDGAVTYPCDDEDKPGNEVIFGEGQQIIKKVNLSGPTYFSDERPDEKFPLVLTTGDC